MPKQEIILALVFPQEKPKSADDKYADIYLINASDREIAVGTSAEFFQTTDEQTGEGITTGPNGLEAIIKPKSALKVGDVEWWELDSALGFDVYYRVPGRYCKKPDEGTFVHYSYNLKQAGKESDIDVLGKKGSVIKGTRVK